MRMNDQEHSEYLAENALQDLHSDEFESFSEYRKEKVRKQLRQEVTYLRNNHPDSYVLALDLPEGI